MEEQVRQEKNKSKESDLNEKQVESKESLRFQVGPSRCARPKSSCHMTQAVPIINSPKKLQAPDSLLCSSALCSSLLDPSLSQGSAQSHSGVLVKFSVPHLLLSAASSSPPQLQQLAQAPTGSDGPQSPSLDHGFPIVIYI